MHQAALKKSRNPNSKIQNPPNVQSRLTLLELAGTVKSTIIIKDSVSMSNLKLLALGLLLSPSFLGRS